MRILKTFSRLVILLSIFCSIQYSAAAEEKAQEEKNVAPERFTRQTESQSHLVVAANPVAVASNDLDPLPRNKRQLGSFGVSLACSALCGALADEISAPCEKICKKLGAIILPLLKDDGLASVLQNVLGSALSGRSAGGPCPCPLIYRPVCGYNRKTYDNACVAKCDDVPVRHKGHCPARAALMGNGNFPCFCAKTYEPVCGTDGKTYGNLCTSMCAEVEVAYSGPCLPRSRSRLGCICPLLHWPVCGVDGVMYPNKCELKCAGVGLAWAVFEVSGGTERRCLPIFD